MRMKLDFSKGMVIAKSQPHNIYSSSNKQDDNDISNTHNVEEYYGSSGASWRKANAIKRSLNQSPALETLNLSLQDEADGTAPVKRMDDFSWSSQQLNPNVSKAKLEDNFEERTFHNSLDFLAHIEQPSKSNSVCQLLYHVS